MKVLEVARKLPKEQVDDENYQFHREIRECGKGLRVSSLEGSARIGESSKVPTEIVKKAECIDP